MFSRGELVFIGVMAAVTFGVGFALGAGLNIATGTPMVGGLLNAVVTAALIAITVKAVRKGGTGIILWLVISALAIPTVTMGPPGAHKLLAGLFGGVVLDLTLAATKRRQWGYVLAGGLMSLAVMLAVFAIALYFGFPAADQLKKYIAYIIPINLGLGVLGTWIGVRMYDKRLYRVPFIQNIQAD